MKTTSVLRYKRLFAGRLPILLSLAVALSLVGACATSDIEPPAQPEATPPEQPETAEAAPSAQPATASPPSGAPSPAADEDAAKPYTNTIKWATASEVDNFGYDVFRSLDEEGPFEKLNAEVIEGAGTTDEPSYYQYVDDTIDPHKTYYYYVESISMAGERERFTPIAKTKPKIAPDAKDQN